MWLGRRHVENRLRTGTDVDAGSVPTAQLASTFSIGSDSAGTLDLDRIGLASAVNRHSLYVLVVADDGEQFGPLTQGGGVRPLELRGGGAMSLINAGLGDPTITVSAGQVALWGRLGETKIGGGIAGVRA